MGGRDLASSRSAPVSKFHPPIGYEVAQYSTHIAMLVGIPRDGGGKPRNLSESGAAPGWGISALPIRRRQPSARGHIG